MQVNILESQKIQPKNVCKHFKSQKIQAKNVSKHFKITENTD